MLDTQCTVAPIHSRSACRCQCSSTCLACDSWWCTYQFGWLDVEIRRKIRMTVCDSKDSFGVSLNCEMVSFAIPSTLEGPPSSRQVFLHNRKQVLWVMQSLLQAIARVCPVTTCQDSVLWTNLQPVLHPRLCGVLVKGYPHLRYTVKYKTHMPMAQVVCYPNGSTWMEHLAVKVQKVCAVRKIFFLFCK